jgi:hypothetical protein
MTRLAQRRQWSWLSLCACVILLAALASMPVEAAAPLVSPSGAGTVVLGPQAMEGALKIHPGDQLWAGFAFRLPSGHPATTAVLTSGYVSLLVKCPNGSSPALTIPLNDQTIVDPAGSTAWYPSGDQSSPLTYQGTVVAPDLCAGAVIDDSRGATFTTAFAATDTVDKFSFRFHYALYGKTGGWSGTAQKTAASIATTVTQATLRPQLGLTLSGDKDTAIPGDVITYTATVTNTGATLSLAGDLYAAATGAATATVVSYWDDVYMSTDGTNWTVLAGTAATAADYVPAVPPPGGSGLVLSPTPIAASGVRYPSGGDRILGTSIGSHDLAHWHYSANAAPTQSQAAALLAGARIRSSFYLEVTPANPNVAQPSTVNLEYTGLLAGSTPSTTVGNLSAYIYPPAGSSAVPLTNAASLAAGESTSWTATFTVPPPPTKAIDESDDDYFLALSALDGAHLAAAASASGSAGSVALVALPAQVTTTEHVPILSLEKTGPSSVLADSIETNPIALKNIGGALAEELDLEDSVWSGPPAPVPGAPDALAPGESAAAGPVTYHVPADQPWGDLWDTATVTWRDAKGHDYGPVSSSFTTHVIPPYGARPNGLFGLVPGLGIVAGVDLDPTIGTINTLADVSDPNLHNYSNLAADPKAHRLFLARRLWDETARVLTVDTTTGKVLFDEPLAHPIDGLQVDPTSGNLYAIFDTTTSEPGVLDHHIVLVNPTDGSETTLAEFSGNGRTLPTALDPVSQRFYVSSNEDVFTPCCPVVSQLYILDLHKNVLTKGPVLARPVYQLVVDPSLVTQTGADPPLGALFGTTGCGSSDSCDRAHLVRVDPGSGEVVQVGDVDLGQLPFGIAVDPATHTIFVSQIVVISDGVPCCGGHVLSIDDREGTVVASPTVDAVMTALVFLP